MAAWQWRYKEQHTTMAPDKNDKQDRFFQLLTSDLPESVRNLRPDQILAGETEHPRRTDQQFSVPGFDSGSGQDRLLPVFRWVASGDMAFKWDDRNYILKAGDFCFTPRMTNYLGTYVRPGDPYELLLTAFHYTDRIWIMYLEYRPDGMVRHNALHVKLGKKLFKEYQTLFYEIETDRHADSERVRGLLDSLVNQVLEQVEKGDYFNHIMHGREKKLRQKSVSQAREYIRQHLQEDLTLEQIAQEVKLNPRYLAVLFKEEYGWTVFEYIISSKLHQAIELFKKPELTVSEIAMQLNFKDVYYFSKVFGY